MYSVNNQNINFRMNSEKEVDLYRDTYVRYLGNNKIKLYY